MAGKNKYTEPADYFPKSLRKEFKVGEYNDDVFKKKSAAKPAKPKKKKTAK